MKRVGGKVDGNSAQTADILGRRAQNICYFEVYHREKKLKTFGNTVGELYVFQYFNYKIFMGISVNFMFKLLKVQKMFLL